MTKLELVVLACKYDRKGEHELAEICRKAALYIAQKEKRHTKECSA